MKLTTEFPFNKEWHVVEVPHSPTVANKILWCKLHESDGTAYRWNFIDQPHSKDCWWFEKHEDAMMFRLKFS